MRIGMNVGLTPGQLLQFVLVLGNHMDASMATGPAKPWNGLDRQTRRAIWVCFGWVHLRWRRFFCDQAKCLMPISNASNPGAMRSRFQTK